MEFVLDGDMLVLFHSVLVEIYKKTEDPITQGYSKGMVNVCVERPLTYVYEFKPFPLTMHKAAAFMKTIISYHPFIDGNKRVALLASFFYLYWNEYNLIIPDDAAEFTIEVAEGKQNLNGIFMWLEQNSVRNWRTILRNKLMTLCVLICHGNPQLVDLIAVILSSMVFSTYPYSYFEYRIAKKHNKEKTQ